MKMLFSLWVCALLCSKGFAEQDSLENLVQSNLPQPKTDTALNALWERAEELALNTPDSALMYAEQGLVISRQMKLPEREGLYLLTIAKVFRNIGNYPKALETAFQSLSIFEQNNVQPDILINLYFIGQIFNMQGDPIQSLSYNFKAKLLAEKLHANEDLIRILSNIGHSYELLNRLDSALLFAKQSYALCRPVSSDYSIGESANLVGDIYSKLGNPIEAMDFYRKSISFSRNISDDFRITNTYLGIAALFKKQDKTDSCLYYSKQSLAIAQKGKFALQVMNASKFLTDYYKEKKVYDSAFAYQQLSLKAKDSIFSAQKIMQFQNISFSEQMRQQEIKEAEVRYRNKVSVYIMFGVIAGILLVAIILWRNNRHKEKANSLLNKQKAEIEFQKTKAEVAFDDLKSTQAQLVQSEKMASLGELTAGVAHEIQNPLNFVNNFSELNTELIAEMKIEIEKGNYDEVKAIANDIEENEQKIKHHGKRADAIVKGMLQHSRSSSGKKEPTDINALADEYLRLAYHGLRAKDKSFNATMKTDFDERIGNINVIPQDIGRVILNMITNAFYSVTEKKSQMGETLLPDGQAYEPTVTVSTKKTNSKIEIRVKDNGNGIPKKVIDKIFQPFFTTKPTGQGTGLGLSLSYDIVKAHGGEINAESKEGEGAEFIITLHS